MLDASAAVELLLATPVGEDVAAELITGQPAVTPVHFDAEVYGALRRIYLSGRLERDRFRTAIDRLTRFDAERVEILSLLPHAESVVEVFGGHDVFYVLLAISRDCPLLTGDLSLGRAAERLGVKVIRLGGWVSDSLSGARRPAQRSADRGRRNSRRP